MILKSAEQQYTHQLNVNTKLTWFDWLWFAVSWHSGRGCD